ncbi:MAG TPA: VOC family protein [Bacillaceae bacterium]|nr:VOC family protein [Bacillaceae bacterium]
MKSPLINEVGAIFIPVRNIEKARDWYCDILGVPAEGEILFNHLYILQTIGTDVVLDSKIYSEENIFTTPAFHFNTNNIRESYDYLKNKQVKLLTEIQHDHYFNFEDPDGNQLMVCKC